MLMNKHIFAHQLELLLFIYIITSPICQLAGDDVSQSQINDAAKRFHMNETGWISSLYVFDIRNSSFRLIWCNCHQQTFVATRQISNWPITSWTIWPNMKTTSIKRNRETLHQIGCVMWWKRMKRGAQNAENDFLFIAQ